MFSVKADASWEKLFPGFDTHCEWSHLKSRAALTRQMAEGVTRRFDTESCRSFDQLVREEIVAALRAGEESEVLYWKLKYFAETNRHSPVIQTDRGKIVYVMQARTCGTVSLVIGSVAEMITIGRKGNHMHYVLPISDRYDFVPYELIGAVARRHLDLNLLIDELAPDASVRDCKVPVLMFSVCERGCEESEATLSCDLTIAEPKRRMTGSVDETISAGSRIDGAENLTGKIIVVVKPQADEQFHRSA